METLTSSLSGSPAGNSKTDDSTLSALSGNAGAKSSKRFIKTKTQYKSKNEGNKEALSADPAAVAKKMATKDGIANLHKTNENVFQSLISLLKLLKEGLERPSTERSPLEHYCLLSIALHAGEAIALAEELSLTYEALRDLSDNLIKLLDRIIIMNPKVAVTYSSHLRRFYFSITNYAEHLAAATKCENTIDWIAVTEALSIKTKSLNLSKVMKEVDCLPRSDDLEEVELLGAGGFGAVYKIIYIPANLTCCIKVIPEDKFTNQKHAVADKLVGSIINSTFLVKYMCAYKMQNAYVIIMEYVPGVDLKRILDKAKVVNGDPLRFLIAQIYLAIEHLHLRGFVHRDIKVGNALVTVGGRVKVIDYDTCKLGISHFVKDRVMGTFFSRTAQEFRDREMAGTLPYMPPETLSRKPYGRSVDFWALGICMFKTLTGNVPFRDEDPAKLEYKIINHLYEWPNTSDANNDEKQFVGQLLQKSPKKRLCSDGSYVGIRLHKYFRGINFESLRSLPSICTVPCLEECLENKSSPYSSKAADEKVKMTIKDLQDAPKTSTVPLLTLVSPRFWQLHEAVEKHSVPDNLDLCGTEQSSILVYDKEPAKGLYKGSDSLIEFAGRLAKFQHLVIPSPTLGCFSTLKLRWAKGATGMYPVVVDAKENILKAGLLVGDIIASVNNELTSTLGPTNIGRAFKSSGSSCSISVFSVNICRFIVKPKMMEMIYENVAPKRVTVKMPCWPLFPFKLKYFVENNDFGVFAIDEIKDDTVVVNPEGFRIFCCDIITEVQSLQTKNMKTIDEVVKACRKNAKKFKLEIGLLPVSPLRFNVTIDDVIISQQIPVESMSVRGSTAKSRSTTEITTTKSDTKHDISATSHSTN